MKNVINLGQVCAVARQVAFWAYLKIVLQPCGLLQNRPVAFWVYCEIVLLRFGPILRSFYSHVVYCEIVLSRFGPILRSSYSHVVYCTIVLWLCGLLHNRPIATCSIAQSYYSLSCIISDWMCSPIPIYNQNQEPNPTGNISLTLNSKRQLMVLALRVLLIELINQVQDDLNKTR